MDVCCDCGFLFEEWWTMICFVLFSYFFILSFSCSCQCCYCCSIYFPSLESYLLHLSHCISEPYQFEVFYFSESFVVIVGQYLSFFSSSFSFNPGHLGILIVLLFHCSLAPYIHFLLNTHDFVFGDVIDKFCPCVVIF